jgi:CBS domain-containing protein
MEITDIMTRDVVTVRPETSLKDVAGILVERRISGVPVVAERGEVVGVVSEADILFKERWPFERKGRLAWVFDHHGMEGQAKLEAHTAAEAMTSPAKTIAPWRDVSVAAAQMLEAGVNRLPVVDTAGRLVGIVTRADLVRAFARSDAEIEREIREDALMRTFSFSDRNAVTVAVDKGKVTLGGSVRARADAELVPAVVARVPGVVEVESSVGWIEDDDRRRRGLM